MAIDPLAEMVERLQRCGFEPREIGHDAWESRLSWAQQRGSCDASMARRRWQSGNAVPERGRMLIYRRFPQSSTSPSRSDDETRGDRRIARRGHQAFVEPGPGTSCASLLGAELARSRAGGRDSRAAATRRARLKGRASSRPKGRAALRPLTSPKWNLDRGKSPSPQHPKTLCAGTTRTDHRLRPVTTTGRQVRLRNCCGSPRARPFRRPDGQFSVSIAVDGHQECHAAWNRPTSCGG